VLYSVPFLRLVTQPWAVVWVSHGWSSWIPWLGRGEWLVSLVRDTFGLLLLVGWAGRALVLGHATVWSLLIVCFCCALSVWSHWDHRRRKIALLSTLRDFPQMHPQFFHDAYFAGWGPWAIRPPITCDRMLTSPLIDFRRGRRARRRIWPVIHAAFSTIFYAALMLLAGRQQLSTPQMRPIADGIITLWGSRLLDLGHLAVQIDGLEHLDAIDGPVIMYCNHTSILDFVVACCALSFGRPQRGEPLHVRFMVAKDHFLDNWLYHRLLVIGRGVKVAGMIMTNRHGTPAQRQQAVPDAVRQMQSLGVDVAIYPQGTRARARYDMQGAIAEPGYYTVGNPHRQTAVGRHLKKGVARLALQAEAAMPSAVSLLPIAVRGAGRVLPKGEMTIWSEQTIRFVIGPPHHLADIATDEAVLATIDENLRTLTGIDPYLTQRLRGDMEGVLPTADLERIVQQLDNWDRTDSTPFATLDAIFYLPMAEQPEALKQFCVELMGVK
jgi:1-acyl-sn-glycerol-3-phosphate acyltransferase